MGQSSNYKQFARSTRILTEESGFAGGMLWTGNNIDASHLKAVVNFDYDDTTGYLKTRDPFIPSAEADFSNLAERLVESGRSSTVLKNYVLLSTHNLCAFYSDDTLTDAGTLYIFIDKSNLNCTDNVWNADLNSNCVVCVFQDADGNQHVCDTSFELTNDEVLTLCNTNVKNTLLLYDNHLYGLGVNTSSTLDDVDTEIPSWMQVFRLQYDEVNEKYTFKQLSFKDYVLPKFNSVALLEAMSTGFNAAKCALTFNYPSQKVADNPYILGVYFTEDEARTKTIISPRLGQDVYMHVVTAYQEGENHMALFELKENTTTTTATTDGENKPSLWGYIGKQTSSDGVFTFKQKFGKKETVLAFTFYGTTAMPEEPEVYAKDAVDYLAPWVVTANESQQNLKVKYYDLTSVDSSCLWRNRMCVWGSDGNNNCLFFSEVDNFYYYPVPNNVAVFDTNIINCIPYKNALLVFTADKIYRISESNDGAFIQDVVQNDMPLSKKDAAQLTAIKNMVLFKSGNYFYMVVPKSQSLTDELSIAPIYKNVAGFLNTLDKSVLEVLQLLYPEYVFTVCDIDNGGKPSSIYSEQDTVHILYDVTASVNTKQDTELQHLQFKLFLNYNTNLRAWTLYLVDTTTSSLEVSSLTSARLMSFIRINYNDGSVELTSQQHSVDPQHSFRVLLDTGYRTMSSAIQKRFREVQLKLYNASESITAFGTAFLLDGVWRRSYSHLQEAITSEGVVSLFPELDLNTFVTELSMPVSEDGSIVKDPGSDAIELSDWTLDFSHFQRGAPVTIRIPVSGKGFNPRFILMAPNALDVYINEVNWVYRIMHGR